MSAGFAPRLQATKLREWFVEVEPDYLVDSIKELDALIVELASDRDRFSAISQEEQSRRAAEDDDALPEMDR